MQYVSVCVGVSLMTLSCATKPPVVVRDFCLMAKPICAKSSDDVFTKQQVSEHNNVGIHFCGWTRESADAACWRAQ